MGNKKLIGLLCIAAAAGAGWWGYTKSQGFGSQLGRAFSGSFSNEVLLAYATAAVLAVVGFWMISRR